MSDNTNGQERKPLLQGDFFHAGLFLVGVLPLVLVGVALFKGQVPGETQATGIAAVALRLVRAFGYFPSLLLFGGVSAVGATLFLGQPLRSPGRHLLGLVGLSLGLAALLGAVAPPGGGRIGEALGGALAQGFGIWAGAAVGLVVMGTTVVFTWMGGKVPLPKKLGKGATLTTALSDLDRDGVSNAETHALVPDASTLKYMEELWGPKETTQVIPLPPSPYPEDVRLKGEIPEGAAPLAEDESSPDETEESQDAPAGEDVPVGPEGAGSHDPHRWQRPRKESSPEQSSDPDLGAESVQSAPAFRIVGGPADDDQDAADRELAAEAGPEAPLPNREAAEAIEAAQALRAEVQASADDPFGLHSPEEQALADLIGLDASQTPAPEVRELPKGVRPLVMDPPAQGGNDSTTQPVTSNAPPRPVWERVAQPEATEAVSPDAPESPEADVADGEFQAADGASEPSEPVQGLADEDADPVATAELENIERDWMRAWKEAGGEVDEDESAASEDSESDLFADSALVNDESKSSWERPETVGEALAETPQEAELEEDALEEAEEEEESEYEDEEEAEYDEEEDPDAEYEEDEEAEYEEGEDEEEDPEAEYEEEEEDPEAEYEEAEEDEEDPEAEYEEEEVEEGEPQEAAELEEGEEYEEEEEDEEAEYEEEDPDAEYEEEDEEGEYEEEEEGEYEDDEEAEYEEEEGEEEDPDAEYEEDEEAEYEEEEEGEYDEEDEGELEEEDEDAEAAELDEPEVEIEPVAAGGTPAARARTWSHSDLVREAGAFLIERRRVGVSLLQRQFELDFETASELLAEFEEVGLIGPYMGGQKRAILLDLEAWQERCASS